MEGQTKERTTTDAGELLRLKDVVDQVGVARSTIADWIDSFSAYIPMVRQGRTKYYGPEAIEVLEFIRDKRDSGFDKLQISEMLPDEFAMNVDEVEKKAEVHRKQSDGRDAVYLAMQQVGELTQRVGELTSKVEAVSEENQRLKEKIEQYEEKLQDQDEQIDKQTEYINRSLDERDRKLTDHMKETIEEKQRQADEQRRKEEQQREEERNNKGFWAKLFGG